MAFKESKLSLESPEIIMDNRLDRLFYNPDGHPRKISEIQQELQRKEVTLDRKTGATYIPEFVAPTFAIRYVAGDRRGTLDPLSTNEIRIPQPNEIIMIPFSISLCGTDAGLITHLKKGNMDPSMISKIAGHEAAGFIVGVGKNVDQKMIGEVMCLDSHYACGQNNHSSFNDCIEKGCDGIVGGIRGTMGSDGNRLPPIDGYWGRIIMAPASAMTIPLPASMAEYLAAPSTLESLGNIYEIVEKVKALGLLDKPERKIFVISGLGATGYPLAVIAKHYGFEVVGIEPTEVNRELASHNGINQVYPSSQNAADYVKEKLKTGEIDAVITAVMSGSPQAYEETSMIQHGITDQKIRKVFIAFGLYADPQSLMPETPKGQTISQREFVFGRQSFTTEDNIEIYGVCGRSMKAWKSLVGDLSPDTLGEKPKNPDLVARLNAGVLLTFNISDFADFALTMIDGKNADEVATELRKEKKVKFAVNLLKRGEGAGFVGN